MQCPECKLENEVGAFYCARCHLALPRGNAPGECPHCGLMPMPGDPQQEVCPSCQGDPERGRQIRERRRSLLQAELEQEWQALERKQQEIAARKAAKSKPRSSCLTLGILMGMIVWFGWQSGGALAKRGAAKSAITRKGLQWQRFDNCDSVSKSPTTFKKSPKR